MPSQSFEIGVSGPERMIGDEDYEILSPSDDVPFRQLFVMTRGYPISYHIPIISSLNPIIFQLYSNYIPIPLTLWTTLDLHFPAGAAMTKFSLKRPTSLAGAVLWQTNLARSISAYLSNCEI